MTDETDGIATVLANLGASQENARTMARQLLKRADQMARQRRCRREEAVEYLLECAVLGRQGITPTKSPPGSPQSAD